MAIEDYTTYAEDDPNSRITVATNKIDFAALTRGENAQVTKDKGANHFAGDFEHLVDLYISAHATIAQAALWALWNAVGSIEECLGGNGIYVHFFEAVTNTYCLRMTERYGGVTYNSSDYVTSLSTAYYLTIKRASTTLTCKIYSDAARTNLLGTLTLTLHSTEQYQYVYALQSRGTLTGSITGYVENLDLQEAAGVAYSKTIAEKIGFVDSHSKVQHHKKTVSEKMGFVDEHDKDKCKKCKPSSVILTF